MLYGSETWPLKVQHQLDIWVFVERKGENYRAQKIVWIRTSQLGIAEGYTDTDDMDVLNVQMMLIVVGTIQRSLGGMV